MLKKAVKRLLFYTGVMVLLCLTLSALDLPGNKGGVTIHENHVPAMAANGDCYVLLQSWDQGDGADSHFQYSVRRRKDDSILQTITIDRPRSQLYLESWRDIVDRPGEFVSFRDLNSDGADDLRVLSANGDGEKEYTAFLWSKSKHQFVESPYPNWLQQHIRHILFGVLVLFLAEAVFRVFQTRRKGPHDKKEEV